MRKRLRSMELAVSQLQKAPSGAGAAPPTHLNPRPSTPALHQHPECPPCSHPCRPDRSLFWVCVLFSSCLFTFR